MSRIIRVLGVTAVFVVFVALICAGALFVLSGGSPVRFIQTEIIRLQLAGRQTELQTPIGTDSKPVRFAIEPGSSPRLIAQRLFEQGLISDPGLFVDYTRVAGLDTELEAGTYFLNQTQIIPQIALILTDSRSSVIPFRILEGWRLEEIAAAIDTNRLFGFTGADFLAVTGLGANADPAFAAFVGLPPGASLEGFMFPDTYQLPPEITPTGLRDTLTETFSERVGAQIPIPADAAAQGLSLYQVVTLASIVQRESVRSEENPMIASVYRNRLNIGMKLDADPTVQYGIGFKDGTWWPQITQADYTNAVHDYNTYLRADLPPGPIANPGLSAIEAAVYPAQSDYFYFRAACDGSGLHNFARTFEEHVANGCR